MNYDPKPSLETWRKLVAEYEEKRKLTSDLSEQRFYAALRDIANSHVISTVTQIVESTSGNECQD